MEFSWSTEADRSVFQAVMAVARLVDPYLTKHFGSPPFLELDVAIWYIPIVMPPSAQARYKARSLLNKVKRRYQCAPQLEYSVFLSENKNLQLKCYLDGLRECAVNLRKLGASQEQSDAFIALLTRAFDDLSGV